MFTNKNKRPDLGDCIALALNLVYTYYVFESNTLRATPAQIDFVAYYTVAMFLLSLVAFTFNDTFHLQEMRRRNWVKTASKASVAVQLVLLGVTFHYWLFAMRMIGALVMHVREVRALERSTIAG